MAWLGGSWLGKDGTAGQDRKVGERSGMAGIGRHRAGKDRHGRIGKDRIGLMRLGLAALGWRVVGRARGGSHGKGMAGSAWTG